MTILGPDGRPVDATGSLVGQSLRIEDFAPFSAAEITEMAGPLQQALSVGMSPQQPAQVGTGVLARLLSTIFHMSAALQAMAKAAKQPQRTRTERLMRLRRCQACKLIFVAAEQWERQCLPCWKQQKDYDLTKQIGRFSEPLRC